MKNKIYSLPTELPVILKIDTIINESETIRSFFFKQSIQFIPGQFFMVWIPGFDEKPFTASYHSEDTFAITIQLRGPFTNRLFSMKTGDILGFRGPYGNGFKIEKGKKTSVIAGGCGIATMVSLIDKLTDPLIIFGAKSETTCPFKTYFKNAVFTTEDGSFGEKGFPTDALIKRLEKEKIDIVYACGPEMMLKRLTEICLEHRIACQFSLERYMKCGFGVCGQCVCGTKRVCADGPVFNLNDLKHLNDFGKYARNKTGKIVELNEYFT